MNENFTLVLKKDRKQSGGKKRQEVQDGPGKLTYIFERKLANSFFFWGGRGGEFGDKDSF